MIIVCAGNKYAMNFLNTLHLMTRAWIEEIFFYDKNCHYGMEEYLNHEK